MKKNIEDKLTFSSIEKLFMVVMVAMVIVAGTTVFTISTRNKNVSNLKEEAEVIISAAKNAYAIISWNNDSEYVVESEDGTEKGMCITLEGLVENGYSDKDFSDWDGYVVIEEVDDNYYYTLWLTDKKYVIDGYESAMISSLKLNDGIVAYNKDEFTSKVETSFTGTSSTKGGTGNSDGTSLKRFEGTCLDKKIE